MDCFYWNSELKVCRFSPVIAGRCNVRQHFPLFFSPGQFKQQIPVRGVRAATEAARTDQLLAYGGHLRWHGDGVTTATVVSDVPARHGAEDEWLADCGSDLLEGTVSQPLPHHHCPHYINTQHTPSIHFTWLHSHTPHRQHPLYIATHHTTSVFLYIATHPTASIHFT